MAGRPGYAAGEEPDGGQDIILDSIAAGVFTTDEAWRVTSFNRAAERITGVERAEALGKPCCEVLRAEAGGPMNCRQESPCCGRAERKIAVWGLRGATPSYVAWMLHYRLRRTVFCLSAY